MFFRDIFYQSVAVDNLHVVALKYSHTDINIHHPYRYYGDSSVLMSLGLGVCTVLRSLSLSACSPATTLVFPLHVPSLPFPPLQLTTSPLSFPLLSCPPFLLLKTVERNEVISFSRLHQKHAEGLA